MPGELFNWESKGETRSSGWMLNLEKSKWAARWGMGSISQGGIQTGGDGLLWDAVNPLLGQVPSRRLYLYCIIYYVFPQSPSPAPSPQAWGGGGEACTWPQACGPPVAQRPPAGPAPPWACPGPATRSSCWPCCWRQPLGLGGLGGSAPAPAAADGGCWTAAVPPWPPCPQPPATGPSPSCESALPDPFHLPLLGILFPVTPPRRESLAGDPLVSGGSWPGWPCWQTPLPLQQPNLQGKGLS